MAMDPAFTCLLYSDIVSSYKNRWLHLDFHLKREVLQCDFSQVDYEQALALFITLVSTNFIANRTKHFSIFFYKWVQVGQFRCGLMV